MSIAHVRTIVIDEADTLLAEKEEEHVYTCIERIKQYAVEQQRLLSTVMVSATIPQSIANTIKRRFPVHLSFSSSR